MEMHLDRDQFRVFYQLTVSFIRSFQTQSPSSTNQHFQPSYQIELQIKSYFGPGTKFVSLGVMITPGREYQYSWFPSKTLAC
jgi:hypothetical protein